MPNLIDPLPFRKIIKKMKRLKVIISIPSMVKCCHTTHINTPCNCSCSPNLPVFTPSDRILVIFICLTQNWEVADNQQVQKNKSFHGYKIAKWFQENRYFFFDKWFQLLLLPPESWQSGRLRQSWKLLRVTPPGVRIPNSPPPKPVDYVSRLFFIQWATLSTY